MQGVEAMYELKDVQTPRGVMTMAGLDVTTFFCIRDPSDFNAFNRAALA